MRLTSVPSGATPWMEDRVWALTTAAAAFSARSHCSVALHRWKPGRERSPLECKMAPVWLPSNVPFPIYLSVPSTHSPTTSRELSQLPERQGGIGGHQEIRDPDLEAHSGRSYKAQATVLTAPWCTDRNAVQDSFSSTQGRVKTHTQSDVHQWQQHRHQQPGNFCHRPSTKQYK